MKFRVEVRDRDFNMVEILDREFIDLNWSYSRIGGCGEFNFTLPRKLFEERAISGAYNVRIYHRNSSTNSYDLWYQGIIENKSPNISGDSQRINISGHGYQSQLKNIYIQQTFLNEEVSAIVQELLDTYIVPDTDISYSAPDIEVTTFTPTRVEFNTDALTAIQTLADIVGTREWGVDKDRNFFFKARSSTVGLRYTLGNNITDYNENQDFKEIVNRIVVQGAQSGGTFYTATYNDTISQLKYGLITKVIQNSSVTTADVAEQLADATFLEYNDAIIKATFDLVGIEAQLEATNPMPLVNIYFKQDKYGEKKFGEGIYCGLVNMNVNRVNYRLTNNNSLKIGVDIGKIRPSLADEISRLTYNLEQQRSAAL